jgi:hypothetical protein
MPRDESLWRIELVGDKLKIINHASGHVLMPDPKRPTEVAQIAKVKRPTGDDLWKIEAVDEFATLIRNGQSYRIINTETTNLLYVKGAKPTSGTRLTTASEQWAASNAARFRLDRIAGTDYYRIVHLQTGKCIDVPGKSSNVGIPLVLWDIGTAESQHQHWKLELGPDGALTITNRLTGLVLLEDSEGAIRQGAANPDPDKPTRNRWRFEPVP